VTAGQGAAVIDRLYSNSLCNRATLNFWQFNGPRGYDITPDGKLFADVSSVADQA